MPFKRYTVFNPDGEPDELTDIDKLNEARSAQMQDYAFRGALANQDLAERERDRQARLAMYGTFADKAALARDMEGNFSDRQSAEERAFNRRAGLTKELEGTFADRSAQQAALQQARYAHELGLTDLSERGATDRSRLQYGASNTLADLKVKQDARDAKLQEYIANEIMKYGGGESAGSPVTGSPSATMNPNAVPTAGMNPNAAPSPRINPNATTSPYNLDAMGGGSVGAKKASGGADMTRLGYLAAIAAQMRGANVPLPDPDEIEFKKQMRELQLKKANDDLKRSEDDITAAKIKKYIDAGDIASARKLSNQTGAPAIKVDVESAMAKDPALIQSFNDISRIAGQLAPGFFNVPGRINLNANGRDMYAQLQGLVAKAMRRGSELGVDPNDVASYIKNRIRPMVERPFSDKLEFNSALDALNLPQ